MAIPGMPGWAAAAAAGQAVLSGPLAGWRARLLGRAGYVTDRIEWLMRRPVPVRVTLSGAAPVKTEVWNDNGNKLLARRSITATHGGSTVQLPVGTTVAYRPASTLAGVRSGPISSRRNQVSSLRSGSGR